jgi:hypothetical protein
MNHFTPSKASATACGVALAASLLQPAQAHDHVRPPAVPSSIAVPAGNQAVLKGRGVGTQNYVCLPAATGFAWTLFTPQATLFNRSDKEITTHYFGPNPDEAGTIRAAWQHSRDTSIVWAQAKVPPSFDPAFVAPGAVPWLLLEVVGKQEGPNGGDTLIETTFIQRVNTAGGLAPTTGCSALSDVGKRAFIPYSADYFFFEREDRY